MQPGGHIDHGETPWEAAKRECWEETGLDVRFVGPFDESGIPELIHVDVHAGGRGHTHLDLRYLFDAGPADGGDADPDPPAGESQEIGWFDWDAAIDLADPGLRGALGVPPSLTGLRLSNVCSILGEWGSTTHPGPGTNSKRRCQIGLPRGPGGMDGRRGARRGTPVATGRRGAASANRSRHPTT